MLEWIAKYWLEIGFGIIVAGGGFIIKVLKNLIKKEFKHIREGFEKKITDEITEQFNKVREESKAEDAALGAELKSLKRGLLSLQGKAFKAKCMEMLDPDHVIDAEEFNGLIEDHETYNALGGNHQGDALFELVCAKYEKTV